MEIILGIATILGGIAALDYFLNKARAAERQQARQPTDKSSTSPSKYASLPEYAAYTRGKFFDVLWRWKYSPNYSDIERIAAYCPLDDTQLASIGPGFTFTQLHCDTCGKDFFILKAPSDLEGILRRQVDQKIRSDRWKQFPDGDNQS